MRIARFREDHLSTIFPLYFNWFQHKVLLTKFCWWVAFLQNPKTIVDGRKCVRVGQKLNLMLNVFLLFLFTIITFTFQPILILCQGDLFLYGSETMICPIKRKGSWVGCLGWQRGRVRTFFLFNPFPLFQIKVEPLNSYFSIIQRKKGTFRNQWQSLYSSRFGSVADHIAHWRRIGGHKWPYTHNGSTWAIYCTHTTVVCNMHTHMNTKIHAQTQIHTEATLATQCTLRKSASVQCLEKQHLMLIKRGPPFKRCNAWWFNSCRENFNNILCVLWSTASVDDEALIQSAEGQDTAAWAPPSRKPWSRPPLWSTLENGPIINVAENPAPGHPGPQREILPPSILIIWTTLSP